MRENKEITMVNLSNVTYTCVWGKLNEQDSSTTALVVEIETDASISREDLLYGRSNCNTSYNEISK